MALHDFGAPSAHKASISALLDDYTDALDAWSLAEEIDCIALDEEDPED